ncbi:MAG: hypothetical protein VBE63_25275, partial [Lamprobacter sp.]|uniref:hypothetical protein n=1 Tax=Lamprobacter sp. TaxID=3100796 RepID=UPI002B25AF3D
FVDTYPTSAEQCQAQTGEEGFYPHRRPVDIRLDAESSLAAQLDLLRVVDAAWTPVGAIAGPTRTGSAGGHFRAVSPVRHS